MKNKEIRVVFHSFVDEENYLSGKTKEEIINIKKLINQCTCGEVPELHEYDCMGDGSYSIYCPSCGRELERSQYDSDIKVWEDVLDFCIRDWNIGLNSNDIKEFNNPPLRRIAS